MTKRNKKFERKNAKFLNETDQNLLSDQQHPLERADAEDFYSENEAYERALAGERSNAENFDSENETKEAHHTGGRKFIQREQGTRDVTALEGRTQNTGRRKLIQREQGTRNVKALEESSRNTGNRPSIFKNAKGKIKGSPAPSENEGNENKKSPGI